MSELKHDSGGIGYNHKVILGRLDDNSIGLKTDNAQLEGYLTTSLNDGTYAGIKTNSTANFTKATETNDNDDTSAIVFWAGAGIVEDVAQVQEAPFQVS
jgi:hypothetical protein